MKRYFRYLKLKKARKIRDEIIICDNYGRAGYLLLKMPNVITCETDKYLTGYEVCKVCTLYMSGGYIYNFTGYGDSLQQYKSMALFAYKRLTIQNNK